MVELPTRHKAVERRRYSCQTDEKDQDPGGGSLSLCHTGSSEDRAAVGEEHTVQGRIHDLVLSVIDGLLGPVGCQCESGDMSIVDRGTRRGSGLVPDCRYFSPSSSSEREAAEPSWEVITNQAIDQVYNKNRALRSKLTTRATKQVTIAAATAPRPKDHTYAKRPDFVTVKDQGTIVLLVCEVKIPWEHPLDGLAKLFEIGDEAPNDNVHEKFRKQLGTSLFSRFNLSSSNVR